MKYLRQLEKEKRKISGERELHRVTVKEFISMWFTFSLYNTVPIDLSCHVFANMVELSIEGLENDLKGKENCFELAKVRVISLESTVAFSVIFET